MHLPTTYVFALMAFAMSAFVGCGGAENLSLVPVSGKITMDGAPLTEATVTFMPTEGTVGVITSVGSTDSQGRYVLKTPDGQVGAVVGMHKVTITDASFQASGGESLPDDRSLWPKPKNVIPPRYNSDSKLTCSVTPQGMDSADFELTSDAKK